LTECSPLNLPYTNNFDADPEYELPPCFATQQDENQYSEIFVANFESNSPLNSLSIYVEDVAVYDPTYLVFQPINNLNQAVVTFDYLIYETNIFYLATTNHPGNSDSILVFDTLLLEENNSNWKSVFSIINHNKNHKFLVFFTDSTSNNDVSLFID